MRFPDVARPGRAHPEDAMAHIRLVRDEEATGKWRLGVRAGDDAQVW